MKKSVFVNAWNRITREVEFSRDWHNGTGYFDGVTKADLGLEPGQIAKSQADGEDLRRMIIIGSRFGNIVIFERYTPEDDDNENIVVVNNAPRKLSRFVANTAISTEKFEQMVDIGIDGWNIGAFIENLFK